MARVADLEQLAFPSLEDLQFSSILPNEHWLVALSRYLGFPCPRGLSIVVVREIDPLRWIVA